ncbi:MAG: hypothetical protein ABFD20_09330 [Anaerolineales bacterium]
MFMTVLVLDDPQRLQEVLAAWEKAGITGVTIFESTGMRRVRQRYIPMRYVSPLVDREVDHITLMAIVPDEERAQTVLRIAEGVIGDLSEPHTGIFAAWPITMVKGFRTEDC